MSTTLRANAVNKPQELAAYRIKEIEDFVE